MSHKQKSRKSVLKRFKISATGKVMRRVSFGRHLRAKKSAGQKRRYKRPMQLTGRVARRVKRLMAIA